MFVPILDDNPLKAIRFQFVTVALIVLNVVIFALEMSGIDERMVASFAIIPLELFRSGGAPALGPLDALPVPEASTLFTYMFLHGDIVHLAGNMLFLWVFGDNVEDAVGHVRFLIFYVLCGIFAGVVHVIALPDSTVPLIGASGAVAGVISAYLILHPRVRVWVLVFRFIPLRITAAFALGAWIATQIVMVLMPQVGPVAWWAHIGGLLAGAVLIPFMRRPGVPLFDRNLGRA
jgi:membrane associated rhomboid family serine protease